jgi:hypothetical protein
MLWRILVRSEVSFTGKCYAFHLFDISSLEQRVSFLTEPDLLFQVKLKGLGMWVVLLFTYIKSNILIRRTPGTGINIGDIFLAGREGMLRPRGEAHGVKTI